MTNTLINQLIEELEKTISEFSEKTPEQTVTRYKESLTVLKTKTIEEIEEFIYENSSFFLRTNIGPVIFEKEEVKELIRQEILVNPARAGFLSKNISTEKLLQDSKIKELLLSLDKDNLDKFEWYGPELSENEEIADCFIERSKKDSEWANFIVFTKKTIQNEEFLNMLSKFSYYSKFRQAPKEIQIKLLCDKKLPSQVLEKIFENLEFYDMSIHDILFQDQEYKRKLFEQEITNSNKPFSTSHSIIPDNFQTILYKENVDTIESLPTKTIINLFTKIHDKKYKEEFLEHFKLLDFISSVNSDSQEKLITNLPSDELKWQQFQIHKKQLPRSTILKMIQSLDIETQRQKLPELLKEQELNNKHITANELLLSFDPNFTKELIEQGRVKVLTLDLLESLYNNSKDDYFLTKAKEVLLASTEITTNDAFYNRELLKRFTEKEMESLLSKVTYPRNINETRTFLIYLKPFEESLYQPLQKKQIQQAISILKDLKEDERLIYASVENAVLNSNFTLEEIKIILDKTSKKTILSESATNEVYADYALQKLSEDPNFFADESINSRAILLKSPTEEHLEKINRLFSLVDVKQGRVFFDNNILLNSPTIKNKFLETLLTQPALIVSSITSDKLEIFTKEQQEQIFKKLPIVGLVELGEKLKEEEKYGRLIAKNIFERREELNGNLEFISYKASELFSFVFQSNLLPEEQKRELINNLDTEILIKILGKTTQTDKRTFLVNEIIKKKDDFLYDKKINQIQMLYSSLTNREIEKWTSNLSFEQLTDLFLLTNRSDLENSIMNKFKENPNIIGSTQYVEATLSKFSRNNRLTVESSINEEFEKNLLVSEGLKEKIKDQAIAKAIINYVSQAQYLTEEKISSLERLLNRNPFLFYSFDPNLLRDELYNLGERFLEKVSKYPKMEKDIVKIFETRQVFTNTFTKLINYIGEKETNPEIYDQKIQYIIEYTFLGKDDIFSKTQKDNLTKEELEAIEIYLLQRKQTFEYKKGFEGYISQNTIEKKERKNEYYRIDEKLDLSNITINNYQEKRVEACNRLFEQENNLEQLKNIYLNRYFGLSLVEVEDFLYTYSTDYDSVKKHAISNIPEKYINSLKAILSLEEETIIREKYHTNQKEFTITDFMQVTGEIKNAYNKEFQEELRNPKTGVLQEKEFNIKTDDKIIKTKVKVIELTDNFNLFVHSTCAYGNMPMINDNYFDSWNLNQGTNNHGICACNISSSSLGTAPVTGNGVMFGFYNLQDHSIPAMAPYDIVSKNDGYTITSSRAQMYLSPKKQSDYTRHTHNECVLERRDLRNDAKFPNIQPDCVVIFEDMSDEIKQNSLKAVEDFKGKGVELEVIYISREKIAEIQADKNHQLIEKYEQEYNLDDLKEIINRYESNICGMDFIRKTPERPNGIDVDYLFETVRIRELLDKTILKLTKIEDVNIKKDQIEQFISIIEEEQLKFDLIEETVGQRAHKFELYDKVLKKQVESLKKSLEKEDLIMDEILEQTPLIIDQAIVKDSIKEVTKLQEQGLYQDDKIHHDIGHVSRVLAYSKVIATQENISQQDQEILLTAAKYHDAGRLEDGLDLQHGIRGANLVVNSLEEVPIETRRKIACLIEYHVQKDNDLIEKNLFDKYQIPEEERQQMHKLNNILKDADALDRVRFRNPKATLNEKFLRTESAKLLVPEVRKTVIDYNNIAQEVVLENSYQEDYSK